MFSHLDTEHEHDRWTDEQRLHLSIVLCSKKKHSQIQPWHWQHAQY